MLQSRFLPEPALRTTKMREKNKKKDAGFLVMIFCGGIAGACLNVALGSFVWNPEGILGGLLSGLLVYLIS